MSESVLVIGAGGFVGQHLVRELARRGDRVSALARRNVAWNDPMVETVTEELREPDQWLPLLERSRVVVHAASTSSPGISAARPVRELDGNLRATVTLLQALQQHPGVPLVYLSSGGSLYDSVQQVADESAPVRPRSYHGAGKVAAEAFIGAFCSQFGSSATILRPSNLYGPGQIERPGFGVVPAAFGKLQRGEPLLIWGNGSALRDYLYIDDFVRLLVLVIDARSNPGMVTVNACSGQSTSLNQLLDTIERVAGIPLKRTYDHSRVVDAPRVEMDAALAFDMLGWRADTSLSDGLRHTWEWFNTFPR